MDSEPDTDRRSRRALLAGGAVALLAGCAGGGTTATSTARPPAGTTPTKTTGTTTTARVDTVELGQRSTVGGADVTALRELAATRSVLVDNRPYVVNALDGRQFVFLAVAVEDGPPPSRRAFSLVVGNQRLEPRAEFEGQVPRSVELSAGYPYGPAEGVTEGWLGFEVPAPVPGQQKLVLRLDAGGETGRWLVPEDFLVPVKGPQPSFAYERTTLPGTVEPGAPFDVGVTLRNAGDGPGQAIVVVIPFADGQQAGQTTSFARIDPDSETTVRLTLETPVDSEATRLQLGIWTSGGNRTAQVDVRQ